MNKAHISTEVSMDTWIVQEVVAQIKRGIDISRTLVSQRSMFTAGNLIKNLYTIEKFNSSPIIPTLYDATYRIHYAITINNADLDPGYIQLKKDILEFLPKYHGENRRDYWYFIPTADGPFHAALIEYNSYFK